VTGVWIGLGVIIAVVWIWAGLAARLTRRVPVTRQRGSVIDGAREIIASQDREENR